MYIQRVHNAKSLKPLGQIDTGDFKNLIYIYIQNNGLGPMIIDKLIFIKGGKPYNFISDCLNLDPKSYWHIRIDDSVQKFVVPNTHFKIFEKNIENHTETEIENIKKDLSSIIVKVNYRDIYDNKFILERNLNWFSRHSASKKLIIE